MSSRMRLRSAFILSLLAAPLAVSVLTISRGSDSPGLDENIGTDVAALATSPTPSDEAALAAVRPEAGGNRRHDARYDQVFPRYAEVCAVTQIKGKDGDVGGTGGHAVIYLKGVCKDHAAAYPRLKMCDPGTVDLSHPDAGTTVSVNKMFSNVNWVAVEKRSLMLTGGLGTGEAVTQATRARIIDAVVADGSYNGIRVHAEYMKDFDPAGSVSVASHIAGKSAGTDFAMNIGRNAYCAKIPVDEAMTSRMVDYLNSLNDQYALTDRVYQWNGLTDNCTHVVHNAFAAAGFRGYKKTGAGFLRKLFNLAFPSNEFIRAGQLGNVKLEHDVKKLWRDKIQKRLISEHGRPMGGPGGMTSFEPMLSEGNELYESSLKMLTASIVVLRNRNRQLKHYSTEPRYLDLITHLTLARDEVSRVIAKLKPLDQYRRDSKLRTDEFAAFYNTYAAYLNRSLVELDANLAALMPASADPSSTEEEIGPPPASH